MKKVLVLSLLLLASLGFAALGQPYLEFNQNLLPAYEEYIPYGGWQAGLAWTATETKELPCPQEDPCGGWYQFRTFSFCGDLFIGGRNIWEFPSSLYAGLDLDLSWGVAELSFSTELGFVPDFGGWPWALPDFDYWASVAELKLRIVDWASGWIGVNLDYDSGGPGYLVPVPYIGFRLGDQYGCTDCP